MQNKLKVNAVSSPQSKHCHNNYKKKKLYRLWLKTVPVANVSENELETRISRYIPQVVVYVENCYVYKCLQVFFLYYCGITTVLQFWNWLFFFATMFSQNRINAQLNHDLIAILLFFRMTLNNKNTMQWENNTHAANIQINIWMANRSMPRTHTHAHKSKHWLHWSQRKTALK